MYKIYIVFLLIYLSGTAFAQWKPALPQNDEERTGWHFLLSQAKAWYAGEEAADIAENILSFQRDCGGWPKNVDMSRRFTAEEAALIRADQHLKDATIDNASTYTHLRFMAKMVGATASERYRQAFDRGFAYLMKAQYENGGWPQFYPLRKGYYSHITYNDDAMAGVLYFLKAIADEEPDYDFLSSDQKAQAREALRKGIDVILKTQIKIDGKRTGWCAQHDEITLKPAPARSYEPVSISGKETVGIVEFLMSIENPSPAVQQAVLGACHWFEQAKISGFRLHYEPDSTAAEGYNRFLVKDETAPPLWARFYSIENMQPIWIDRDGIIRRSHAEISPERRNNYAYVEQFASDLLEKEFPAWAEKHPRKGALLKLNDQR